MLASTAPPFQSCHEDPPSVVRQTPALVAAYALSVCPGSGIIVLILSSTLANSGGIAQEVGQVLDQSPGDLLSVVVCE